ncbi:MAG: hypothetical protein ABR607_03150 [Pyrinomonadaceae bacterium]
MKRKILIVILGLIVLSQIPFAYRRYRLRRLRNTIQQLAAQRITPISETEYIDYKGVIHVHSFLGGHSTGTFAELIAAAKVNQLDFVIMTEHARAEYDTSAMTLNGIHAGVLFINGNEVVSANGDRLLLIPGISNSGPMNLQSTQQIIEQQKLNGGVAIAAYPAESETWKSAAIDGVEVYNLFTNARQIKPLVMFFDGLWSYGSYADVMFANFFQRPDENLRAWDETISATKRKLVATAGNDAHSNVGVSVNDSSGKQLIGLKLDPYERSFRTVRTHVLIKRGSNLTPESLLAALSQGHCYISFDSFAEASGFSFSAKNSDTIMGDEISASSGSQLVVQVPLPARILMIRDGNVFAQRQGTTSEFSATGPGVYRVEVYLDNLSAPATGKPWIISNPIYLR